jgi:hypothetical protein
MGEIGDERHGNPVEAVECDLKYSGVGLAFLLLAAGATCGVVLAMPMDALPRAALLAYTAGVAARACRSLIEPRAVRIDPERRIEVLARRGWLAGTVRDGSFVLPWLTIVRWRPDAARTDRWLLLLPDMSSADDLRKIRVILRWA